MSRCAAPAMRWHGSLRQLAVALLLVALGAFLLQATAAPGVAADMAFGDPTIATAGHGCDHSQPMAGEAALAEPCSPAEAVHGGHCQPLCTMTALLPPVLAADAPPGTDFLSRTWPDRSGRLPAGILRPPRFPAAA